MVRGEEFIGDDVAGEATRGSRVRACANLAYILPDAAGIDDRCPCFAHFRDRCGRVTGF
jgi:hypothetical protein